MRVSALFRMKLSPRERRFRIRIISFTLLYWAALCTTSNLAMSTIADLGGQWETDVSGTKIFYTLLLLLSPVALLCGILFLPQLIWATVLEALYTRVGPKRHWSVSLLVVCCTVTALLYIGLTEFAAQNIGTFVRERSMAGYLFIVRIFAGPVFYGLLDGISVPHILLYCALWGIPLGIALEVFWRFVVRRMHPPAETGEGTQDN